MKVCTRCNKLKDLSNFYNQTDRKRGASWCKECFNSYCVKRWIKKKIDAITYKGGACVRCGYNEHYAALQFHHLDPSRKEYTWNKLRLRSWDDITNELDKCLLLCANCHAIEHANPVELSGVF